MIYREDIKPFLIGVMCGIAITVLAAAVKPEGPMLGSQPAIEHKENAEPSRDSMVRAFPIEVTNAQGK